MLRLSTRSFFRGRTKASVARKLLLVRVLHSRVLCAPLCFFLRRAHCVGSSYGQNFGAERKSADYVRNAVLLCNIFHMNSPLFVSWENISGDVARLRGCIGSLTPRYLHGGLHEYALHRYCHAIFSLAHLARCTDRKTFQLFTFCFLSFSSARTRRFSYRAVFFSRLSLTFLLLQRDERRKIPTHQRG